MSQRFQGKTAIVTGASRGIGVVGTADDVEHQAVTVRQATETFGSVDLPAR
jgi:short-subunit dehydrogenase